ncbi:hypothetical protein PTSG_10854 [Salpingoeca rosetta]|uniref:Peptidase M10 metallopeptidase domain-containing protein n=1 Tax=Salpingoeca rosetta (strain ATCC 50818 / BSB-021) TaxID=946362 RepID=F2URK3_SALR5|nr:uncharacterized protein PTSG_10854 [Salpingoeca rosetta]EGD80172.1 hypothetical protein PTSG_10854 [Salpingoeca rosetta]|eukprot:XP_004988234.1 hypothetical protein PTSG_10854 [Salpingoeca rosetta]
MARSVSTHTHAHMRGASLVLVGLFPLLLSFILVPGGTMMMETAKADALADFNRVYEALNVTYFGGVTKPMADRIFSRADIPHMITILNMGAAFERQDNTVVFLGYLSNDSDPTVGALRQYWDNFATVTTPAARRSALLVPHALGLMAQLTESQEALSFMQDMLADLNNPITNLLHAILPKLSPDMGEQEELLTGLVKQLLRGLSFYNGTILATAVQLLDDTLDLVVGDDGVLDGLTDVVDDIVGGLLGGSGSTDSSRPLDGEEGDDGFFTFLFGSRRRRGVAPADDSPQTESIVLDYCQHTGVSDAFTNSDVDRVAAVMTSVASSSQASFDVACCLEFTNGGEGARFGLQGDGLSVVDNKREAAVVFNQGCGRIKIVNVINYCGQPASNVIGCAPVGGDTEMLVRLSSHQSDARLWLHETGHNVGLGHNRDSADYIMYPTLTGNLNDNFALTLEECGAFHSPPPTARVQISATNATCASVQQPPGSGDGDDDDGNGGGGGGGGSSDGSSGLLTGATSWAVFGVGIALAAVAVVVVSVFARARAGR